MADIQAEQLRESMRDPTPEELQEEQDSDKLMKDLNDGEADIEKQQQADDQLSQELQNRAQNLRNQGGWTEQPEGDYRGPFDLDKDNKDDDNKYLDNGGNLGDDDDDKCAGNPGAGDDAGGDTSDGAGDGTQPNAAGNAPRLPGTRAELDTDLTSKGFVTKGTGPGGYTTYTNPDGRVVTIKPTGEVIPTSPAVSSTGKAYNQRTDYNFNRLPDQSHSTGHFVEPNGEDQ
jgi:hypothetical protein